MSGAPVNVIDVQFGEKESFDEFLAHFVDEVSGESIPPDEEVERQALLAIAVGNYDEGRRIMSILDKKKNLGLARVK